MYGPIRVIRADSPQRCLELVKVEAHEGHRTGHLAVEAPTIHAETGVASFD